MRTSALFLIVSGLLLFVSFSVTEAQEGVDLGVTLEIVLEPEKPTVVVTITRQDPDITIGELRRPKGSSLFSKPSSVKPHLADIEIDKIKKPKKMLAKVREH
ncbi:hypothetical protein HQ587_07740 [bacterium]|nr:hypothetical protein [bacterium]